MTQMDVRRRTVEGNAKLFTHCQLKEVFIKLKQVSGINRKLKKKNIYPQMTRMVTDGGPQADFVGERGLMIDDWLLIIRTALIFRGARQAKASSSQAHQAAQVLD